MPTEDPKFTKIEKNVLATTRIYADDISVYPQQIMKGMIVYGGEGRAEHKHLPIRTRVIVEDRPKQLVFEFEEEYHVEKLTHFVTNPELWYTYGKFWLPEDEAIKLANFILENIGKEYGKDMK
jgi:hypothetical protein